MVERTVTLALEQAVPISAPEVSVLPAELRRADGTSRFRAPGSATYTTREVLDAENRLLQAARSLSGPSVSPLVAADTTTRPLDESGVRLSADQAAAVRQVVTSGRVLDVLVGPAGTGKTTTMAGVRAAWEAEHGPGSVVGLAPSAAAAEVLARRGRDPDREHHQMAPRDRDDAHLKVLRPAH